MLSLQRRARGCPGLLPGVQVRSAGDQQGVASKDDLYRPLSSLMFFSRLLRERLAGTPYAEHFLGGEA